MSWEPDTPVGFSPCGQVFGALRKCYNARCKFYAGDTEADNRINWYWARPDAEIYEGPNVFVPRVDSNNFEWTSLHEHEGPGRFVRTFNDGDSFVAAPGQETHGDDQDFLGQSPRSKHYVDGVPPVAPCNVVGRLKNGIAFGGEMDGVEFASLLMGGVRLGGKLSVDPPILGGVQLGGKLVDYGEGGVKLGGLLSNPNGEVETLINGVHLGGDVYDPSPDVESGVRLGGFVGNPVTEPPNFTTLEGGILFGGEVIGEGQEASSFLGGLRMGGIVYDPIRPPPNFQSVQGGVEFGGVVIRQGQEASFLESGVKFGGLLPPMPNIIENGVALGGEVIATGDEASPLKGGVALGGDVHS